MTSEVNMGPDNTYILMYPNDMMDGIIWEDESNYAFISAHAEGYDELADELETLGVEVFDMTDCEIDYDTPPHSWVAQSIGQTIIRDLTALLAE